MTETAEISRPHTFTEEEYRATLLANLRVARARAKLVVHEIDEIGFDLKERAISPREALRLCMRARIDALFPREGDGA
jgi:hypothetical protein